MAIRRREDQTNDEQLNLDINNGDLAALRRIVQDWGFLDEESALRYALAVLTKAEDHTVYIEQSGKKVGLDPSDSLRRETGNHGGEQE